MKDTLPADPQLLSHKRLREAYEEADRRLKSADGHSFVQILKCRCIYCNRSPNQKGKCPHWFAVYLDRLAEVLHEWGYTK